ncbi:ATP-binding cassette domain-containing protein, partial [Pseudomonas aeruginosa]|nr:ATP-binding cassette domain-containing protein [Pseudomonas aeruginosa]
MTNTSTLTLDGVSFQLPDGSLLFSDLDETFDTRHTGLVGRNGVGKSLLARLLAGHLQPSSGSVRRQGRVRYLAQQLEPADYPTVADLAGVRPWLEALARIEAGSLDAADYECLGERWDIRQRLADALAAEGLGHLRADTPSERLSGGECMRVALLGAFLDDADFLILDEPSNPLDGPARALLRARLAAWDGGLLLVSHDRELLEGMQRIVELSTLGLRSYGGGYSFYAQSREEAREAAERRLDQRRLERKRQTLAMREQQQRQERRQASGRREGKTANQAKILLGGFRERSEVSAGKLRNAHQAERERLDREVREVIDGLQRQIGERGDLDKVSFGLVGFRNNTDKTPGLEYVSKTLVPLQPGNDAQRFAELSSQVRATDVSSHSFNEDAFAGIMQAVDEMDWSPYAGRVVLLVTDAGALRKNDPLGRTQMNEAEVRQAALRKGVKIYALHLRTPAGKNNHGYAEQQYRSLTADANPKIADLYIPVAGGEVNAFGNTVKEIGTVFADLVHDAGNRKPQAPRFDAAPSVASKSAAIGYAMQMEFLGRRDPVRAPQVVTAWTADRDLTNPALPAFQVCVLLSKLQLNELQQSLKLIVDAAKRTQTSPKDFFQEIASASAYMSRDPAQLVKGSNLAQSGVLGEYLEGLPYRSKSLNMTQDLWLSLSVAEQQDFIDELESKIRLYETFHNDVANWVRFGDADAGDA